ncbi:hypothetical protein L1887_30187 [Cichorium endivia]|nr:hypothetical protein L1887_30187 [Cichorium endivia]
MKPRWSSTVDQELLYAKLQIGNAPVNENDHTLHSSLYVDISRFKSFRSYALMEKTLKINSDFAKGYKSRILTLMATQ